MFGLFLVVLGALFLMEEMGLIQGNFWGYFWPLILIALGLNMIFKSKKEHNCFSFWCADNKKHHKHDKKHHHDKVVDDQ